MRSLFAACAVTVGLTLAPLTIAEATERRPIVLAQFDLLLPGDIVKLPAAVLAKAPFAGEWDTVTGGVHYRMQLQQVGDNVAGTYQPNNGTITSYMVGTLPEQTTPAMAFEWREGSGASGYGYFQLSEDGQSFEGGWHLPADVGSGALTPWTGTRVASVPERPAQPAETTGFNLTCLGGGGMSVSATGDGFIRIPFAPATAGTAVASPGPGQCGWSDRGMAAGEPHMLILAANLDKAHDLVAAVDAGGRFKVRASNNGQGAMVVTVIEEAEIAAIVEPTPGPAPEPPSGGGQSGPALRIAIVTEDLNVRSAPDAKADNVLGILPGGAQVPVIGCNQDRWCRLAIDVPGGSAWVAGRFLRFQ